MKRSQPTRDWTASLAKLEAEPFCRVCGSMVDLEQAHIVGRSHDEPKTPGSKTLWVNPDRIVILCGPFPAGCHGAYDHKRLDLLSYLTPAEQAQAALDAGSLELARKRLCPSAFQPTEAVEAAPTQNERSGHDR